MNQPAGVGFDQRALPVRLERQAVLALKRFWRGACPASPRELTLLAGMQRSGTNMVMEVIERSFDATVVHETDPRGFDHYQMRPPEVIDALRARCRTPVFVIKALCELQQLRHLLERFQPARAIWVVRRHEDVVNSLVVSFPRQGRHLPALVAGDTAGWRGEGMSAATLAALRRLYHPGMDNANAAALMWYLRNVLFFEQELDRDPRVLVVAYEDLVTDPRRAFARIFGFLGLSIRPWHTRRVRAGSIRRRSPPALEPGVRELCDALAERFRKLISPPPT